MRVRPPRLVLGLDVALRTFGWALAFVGSAGIEPVSLGMIKTEPGEGPKSRDNYRCAGEIAVALNDVISIFDGERVSLVCAEAMSYPPGAASAARISIAWGVVASVTYGIPFDEASPQRIKKAVVGRVGASKRDVQDALIDRFGIGRMERLLVRVKRGSWEHPCDALAAVVALA